MLIDTFEELLRNGLSAENALNELKRQLKRQNEQLYNNKKILNFRNKFIYFYFILLIITFIFSFLGFYYYLYNNFFAELIMLIIMVGNGYVYSYFCSYYIKEIKNKINENNNKINDLDIQIDIALKYLNIEKK